MLHPGQYDVFGNRDLRIDWLRGLAMTCVIVDHSRISSLLTWFSYQRFWTVTAAEVFVVLSGIVLGMVYGRKLRSGDWRRVVRGLGRRALTLYIAFVAVTLSVLAISLWGTDVSAVTEWGDDSADPFPCFLDPPAVNATILARVVLMRCGPWPFTIVGLYVWLVAAAIPALLALHYAGWRRLLAASWTLYVAYRLAPLGVTMGGAFEGTFPLLVWQLLFVHGLAIGYHREHISAAAARSRRFIPVLATATVAFAVLAMCNPWTKGPAALHWNVVSVERFTDLYYRYFTLPDLGVGRILNLAVALPVGYALLTSYWRFVRPLSTVFVTLGQQSLGAFVLHVYGLIMITHVSLDSHAFWTATALQIVLVAAIAGLLIAARRLRLHQSAKPTAQARPLAA